MSKTEAAGESPPAQAGETRKPKGTLCSATNRRGKPCPHPARKGKDVCWNHDPETVRQRQHNARAGGYAVKNPAWHEIEAIKAALWNLAEDVLSGDVAPNVAGNVNQIYNSLLRGVSEQRSVKETDELEARLDEIEDARRAKEVA